MILDSIFSEYEITAHNVFHIFKFIGVSIFMKVHLISTMKATSIIVMSN